MVKHSKILVLSLKGGTGKTTTTLGIARALRARNYKVGLLDVDIHASALPKALGLELKPGYERLTGGKLRPIEVDNFQMYSVGLIFGDTLANMWDGEMKASAVKQIVTTAIAWDPDLDFIVVDTPPTSGDEVLSLLQNMTNIYGAVIVCQPNDLSILGIVKTLDVMRETGTPILGIAANMVGFRCPNCGVVNNPFDSKAEDILKITREFKIPYLGEIPFASEDERLSIMNEMVGKILDTKPVVLKPDKVGGITRWALEKLLK